MKHKYWLIFGIIVLIGITLIFSYIKQENKIPDFEPTITQGVYGTAFECHGSAEPPLTGTLLPVQVIFKIRNLGTDEVYEITTNEDGTYEYVLMEGRYMMIVSDHPYAEIRISEKTLIKKNIGTKACPV